MNTKRKMAALIAAALLLAPLLGAVSAAAETEEGGASAAFTVTVGSGSLAPDGTLLVPVTASGCPGVAGYRLTLAYDKTALQVSDIIYNQDIEGQFSANLDGQSAQGPVVIWHNAENVVLEGTLFCVVLKPVLGAPAGEYTLGVDFAAGDICNEDYAEVPVQVSGGRITRLPWIIAGDLDGSGVVNAVDMQNLYTYLSTGSIEGYCAGQPERYCDIADVNGNGTVNILDYQCLYGKVKKGAQG